MDRSSKKECRLLSILKKVKEQETNNELHWEKIEQILKNTEESRIQVDLKEITILMSKSLQSVVRELENAETLEDITYGSIIIYNISVVMAEIMSDLSVAQNILNEEPEKRCKCLLEIVCTRFAYWERLYKFNISLSADSRSIDNPNLLIKHLSILEANKMTIFNRAYWNNIVQLLEDKFKKCKEFDSIEEVDHSVFNKRLERGKSCIQILNELSAYCHMMCVSEIESDSLTKKFYKNNIAAARCIVREWESIPFISENTEFFKSISSVDVVKALEKFEKVEFILGAKNFCKVLQVHADKLQNENISGEILRVEDQSFSSDRLKRLEQQKVFIKGLLRANTDLFNRISERCRKYSYFSVQRDTSIYIVILLAFLGAHSMSRLLASAIFILNQENAMHCVEEKLRYFFVLATVGASFSFSLSVYYLRDLLSTRKHVCLCAGMLLVLYAGLGFSMCILHEKFTDKTIPVSITSAVLVMYFFCSLFYINSIYRIGLHVRSSIITLFSAVFCIVYVLFLILELKTVFIPVIELFAK